MKTKRPKYTAPNLKVDAILILLTCFLAIAHHVPVVSDAPVYPVVNPSK